MPIIAVQVETLSTPEKFMDNALIHLRQAGIPQYSYKDQQEGFEFCPSQNEGETNLIWHTFNPDDDADRQRAGLERIAALFNEYYWVKLDVPSLYTKTNRPLLRVLYGLHWLS